MSKNTSFVISVMEQDRVGIIADVSGIIKKLGGNLADVSQTVMRGYFTMILLADFTREVTAGEIRDAFAENPSLAAAAAARTADSKSPQSVISGC